MEVSADTFLFFVQLETLSGISQCILLPTTLSHCALVMVRHAHVGALLAHIRPDLTKRSRSVT